MGENGHYHDQLIEEARQIRADCRVTRLISRQLRADSQEVRQQVNLTRLAVAEMRKLLNEKARGETKRLIYLDQPLSFATLYLFRFARCFL
jgi:hypothetical protein